MGCTAGGAEDDRFGESSDINLNLALLILCIACLLLNPIIVNECGVTA